MIPDVEKTLPSLYLKTCRKRTAFACLFLFFHWAFVLAGHFDSEGLWGLILLAMMGLVIYPSKALTFTSRLKPLIWIVLPSFLGLALALVSAHHYEQSLGLLPLSLNLFCFTMVPLEFYRWVSPVVLFSSTALGLWLMGGQSYSPFYKAALLASNLAMSMIGFQISNWLQNVHKSRITPHSAGGDSRSLPASDVRSLSAVASRGKKGFILQFDLRGFSALVREVDESAYEKFMQDYYELVSVSVGKSGGTIHRTSGDCHVVCFGIFGDRDKSEFDLMENAFRSFDSIVKKLGRLSEDLGLPFPLSIGGALDYGELRVRVFGHEDYQQEVDLVGSVLIRCARLEAHTKAIMSRRLVPRSMLILSPDVMPFTSEFDELDIFCVREQPIRDFGQIRWLAFREFDSTFESQIQKAA